MPGCSPKPSHPATFGHFGTNPLPHLVFANAPPRNRRRLVRPAPPPTSASLHLRLTWQTRNRATAARFRVFGLKPPPPRRVCERATPRPPSPRTSRSTTYIHLPPPSFDTAGPKPPPPRRVCKRATPRPLSPRTSRSTAHIDLPPPSVDTADPKPSTAARFRVFGLNPPNHLALANAPPHDRCRLMRRTLRPSPISFHCRFQRRA